MTRIFFHGLWVLGWPWEITSRSNASSACMSLCLNVRSDAPLRRTPKRIEA
jgi:hypothetical protein